MNRVTKIATLAILLASGFAGTAVSQVGKPLTAPASNQVQIAPAALFEARLDKLEKEVGGLKGQVARLCTAYDKLAKTTKNIRKAPISAFSVTGSKISLGYSNGSGDKDFVFVATDQESVTMQPAKLGDCP